MNREIYVMCDSVSGAFGEPFTMANHAELRREFDKTIKNPAVPGYAFRDVIILHLGTFYPDIENPRIVPLAVPTTILRGDTYNYEENRGQISDLDASSSELSFN